MKKLILLLLFAMVALVSVAQPTMAYSNIFENSDYTDKKIVFLGDSVTYGTGVTEHSDRFADIVSYTLQFETYINMGVSGSSIAERVGETDSFLERAPSIPVDADYVVILGGFNDYINDVPIVDFTADIAAMLTAVEVAAPNALIILMTPYDATISSLPSSTVNVEGLALSDYVDVMIAAGDQTADTTPVINLLDLNGLIGFDASDGAADTAEYTLDGLHTNIAGNERIANILLSYFSGDNLLDATTWTDGYYINSGTATAHPSSYSSLIPVEAGKSYVLYNITAADDPMTMFGQYHDENGDYVSNIDSTIDNIYKVFTVPDTVEFVRVNAQYDDDYKAIVFLRELENYETFIVTFATDGGSAVAPQILEVGLTATLPDEPVKTGYSFVGWYSDTELTTIYDFDDIVTDDLILHAKWALPTSSSLVAPSEDTALFGLAWYWWAVIAISAYGLLGTKQGRKYIGLK
jgi:uncharacterized repeat protein (TIGR02543 family)